MPDTLPFGEIEHRIPGRLRLRVRAKRGDAAFFQNVADRLGAMTGVRLVRANSDTGSILLEHDGEAAAILAGARAQSLFESGPLVKQPSPLAPLPLDRRAPAPLDLAAIGLTGAGLLQLARGRVVGSASENLWNAYGLYAITRNAGLPLLLAGFGLLQIARGEVLGSATSLFLYALSARRMARHRAIEDTI